MRPVVLVIRDGWGVHEPPGDARRLGDATRLASTPVADALLRDYPTCRLHTEGAHVGLPEGQMGNSEVGHLNLGAGRVVYQQLTRIDRAIDADELVDNPVLEETFAAVESSGGKLHLMGLCSDGGVHSQQAHLLELLGLAARRELSDVIVHCFTDGRDTAPQSGQEHVREIESTLAELGVGVIGSVSGRYFAMDRDKNWERTERSWSALVGEAEATETDAVEAIRAAYDAGVTDEFIEPFRIAGAGETAIADGDAVLFFNFRADRARQITRALVDAEFDGFERLRRPQIFFACMTEYDPELPLPVLFPPADVRNTLAEVLAAARLRQFHIAETEKYAHVTYFFNGGREAPVAGEERVLVQSPDVDTYDLQPEMSAAEVTREIVERIEEGGFAFLLINYANPDMVGHTGSLPAAIAAVEATDRGVGAIVEAALERDGTVLVTADHGNCEQMIADDGGPHTAHTTNRVDLVYVARDAGDFELADGILADVAPTVLDALGIEPPEEMTGRSLRRRTAAGAAESG